MHAHRAAAAIAIALSIAAPAAAGAQPYSAGAQTRSILAHAMSNCPGDECQDQQNNAAAANFSLFHQVVNAQAAWSHKKTFAGASGTCSAMQKSEAGERSINAEGMSSAGASRSGSAADPEASAHAVSEFSITFTLETARRVMLRAELVAGEKFDGGTSASLALTGPEGEIAAAAITGEFFGDSEAVFLRPLLAPGEYTLTARAESSAVAATPSKDFFQSTYTLALSFTRGDVNGDGAADIQDLSEILSWWGLSHGPSDLNDDGVVDARDLAYLLGWWGNQA